MRRLWPPRAPPPQWLQRRLQKQRSSGRLDLSKPLCLVQRRTLFVESLFEFVWEGSGWWEGSGGWSLLALGECSDGCGDGDAVLMFDGPP